MYLLLPTHLNRHRVGPINRNGVRLRDRNADLFRHDGVRVGVSPQEGQRSRSGSSRDHHSIGSRQGQWGGWYGRNIKVTHGERSRCRSYVEVAMAEGRSVNGGRSGVSTEAKDASFVLPTGSTAVTLLEVFHWGRGDGQGCRCQQGHREEKGLLGK